MTVRRIIIKPIKALHAATEIISSGKLDYRVDIKTEDEFGQLGGAFNGMTVKLKESYTALEEKTRAEFEEKVKLRTLLESIGDGVVAIDRNWNIVLWNEAASQISGWQETEVLGKSLRNFIKLIREQDREENIHFIEEAMISGKAQSMENNTLLVTKDGREIPVGDSAAPIPTQDGKVAGAIIVFRDVSKEREANLVRSDFAYASHQLRTPVTKAMWYLEVALEEQNPQSREEKIRVAYQSMKSIQKIAGELVDVSEIDQGTVIPRKETVKLADILGEVVNIINPQAKERGIRLVIAPVSSVVGIDTDPKLMKGVLLKILENAMRYSIAKGEVKVNTLLQEKQKSILIEIQDTGIGIPTAEQPLVFAKFFRGSNFNTTDISGAGLGLYIAREYMKLLGGKVWFKSEEKKGTTFSILLPIS